MLQNILVGSNTACMLYDDTINVDLLGYVNG